MRMRWAAALVVLFALAVLGTTNVLERRLQARALVIDSAPLPAVIEFNKPVNDAWLRRLQRRAGPA